MDTREHRALDLEQVRQALVRGAVRQVEQRLGALNPGEIARLLESLPPDERELLWEILPEQRGGDVLAELNDEVRTRLAEGMDAEALTAAAREMDLDDLADVLGDLPDAVTRQILQSFSDADRQRLEAVLAYPEDTAGGLMNPETVSVRPDVTVDTVLRYLRRRGAVPARADCIFVVDRAGRYLGVLHLTTLITQAPELEVRAVMDTSVVPMRAELDATAVTREFRDRDLISAPVVDDAGLLLGQITVDDVMDVVQEQADHDVLGMAGLDEEDDMFAPVLPSSMRRAVWLATNLVTAFCTATVISFFEATIDRAVILAVLMPIVASMGGIAGSQTLTLMTRGIALGRVQRSNAAWLLGKELAVGAVNSVIWALVAGAVTVAFFSTWQVGAIIAAALGINLLVAALAGFGIPLVLRRMGIDPALAGSVVLITLTDIVGFGSILALGSVLLRP